MEDAVKTPNVVEATNKPGLYNKLEDLKKRWVPTPVHAGTCAPLADTRQQTPGPGSTHPRPWGPGHILPRRKRGLQRSNHTPPSRGRPGTPRVGGRQPASTSGWPL